WTLKSTLASRASTGAYESRENDVSCVDRPPAIGTAQRSRVRSTEPDVSGALTYTTSRSGANAIGPYTSSSGFVAIAAPPHGMVTRDRPFSVATHAISPRGVHAGKAMRLPIFFATADEPSAAMVHSSCPSRALTIAAMKRPAGDQASWRRS